MNGRELSVSTCLLGHVLAVGLLVPASPAGAAPGGPLFDVEEKLLPQGLMAEDQFGYSIAVDGVTAAVGARWDDDRGIDSGSAAIFERHEGGTDQWGEVERLAASDGVEGDWFGTAVAVDGDLVIVGAPGGDPHGTQSGAVYIFHRHEGGLDNWGAVKKITASDGAPNALFGVSVSVSGDSVAVGAYGDASRGANAGAVYVFSRDEGGLDNWGEVTKIVPQDGAAGDRFGVSVCVSGETLAAGADSDDDHGEGSGSVYVHSRDLGGDRSWGLVRKITPDDGSEFAWFGRSLSLSGDSLAVGAWGDSEHAESSGAVYVFDRDRGGADHWGFARKLAAPDASAYDRFGYVVSLDDDTLVVGANWDDDGAFNAGSAYVFYRDRGGPEIWGQVAKVTASDGDTADEFGSALSVSGESLLAGVPFDDDLGESSGSAYVFSRDAGGIDRWGEARKLQPGGDATGASFGFSVDAFDEVVVAGAPQRDGTTCGSAHVFQRDPDRPHVWSSTRVTADCHADDQFGYSVATDGDFVAVGSPGSEEDLGMVFVFQRDEGGPNAWGQIQSLQSQLPRLANLFGRSTAMSRGTLVIGEPTNHHEQRGDAWIVDDLVGTPSVFLLAPPITSDVPDSSFGTSVAISDDANWVAVGAPTRFGAGAGAVYVFYRDRLHGTWVQSQKLVSTVDSPTAFGHAVSLDHLTLAVRAGAIEGIPVRRAPYVHVFYRDLEPGAEDPWREAGAWPLPTDISATSGGIRLRGDAAIMGLPTDEIAFVLSRDPSDPDGWDFTGRLAASDSGFLDHYALSVAFTGERAVIGAWGDGDLGEDSGSAYVYETFDLPEGMGDYEVFRGRLDDGEFTSHEFLHEEAGELRAHLRFGSEFRLRAYRPDGSLTDEAQSDISPIDVAIADAEAGVWSFEVTAADAAPSGSAYVLVIGSTREEDRHFRRGDSNDDGDVNITDAIVTLGVLFLGKGEITCQDGADANDDGGVDITDPIFTLNVLFLGRGQIPPPGMNDCGPDPTADELTCESYEECEPL